MAGEYHRGCHGHAFGDCAAHGACRCVTSRGGAVAHVAVTRLGPDAPSAAFAAHCAQLRRGIDRRRRPRREASR